MEPHVMDSQKDQSLPVNSVDYSKTLVGFSTNSLDQAQNAVEMPKNGEFSVKEDSKNVEDDHQKDVEWADSLLAVTTSDDSDSSGSECSADADNVPCYSDWVEWPSLEAKPIVSIQPEPKSHHQRYEERRPMMYAVPVVSTEPEPESHHQRYEGTRPVMSTVPVVSTEPQPKLNHQRYEETRPVMSAVPLENNQNPNVVAGLINLGNTCFLNAVLQAIMHTMALLQLIVFRSHGTPCYGCWRGFCLFSVFKELIELALLSNGGSISPWKLVDNLTYFSSNFTRYQQEDAHEFLQHFLDKLESCCPNIVKQVFGGRLVSKLRCCNCGHISNTYEPLIDVNLEIKDVETLTEALDSFTRVEKITYSCERCNSRVSFDKQLMLDKAPAVASFHLKRFANTGLFVEKVDKQVSFPLELDLLPYIDNHQNNNEETKYDLYAVIVHAGASPSSGHYYSYIRYAPNEWFKFDDSKVFQVHEDLVLAEEAYILFYAKKGTMWFSNLIGFKRYLVDTPKTNASPQLVVDNVKEIGQTSTSGPTSGAMYSYRVDSPVQVPRENKLQQDLDMKQACTVIKKRISGSRDDPEQLKDALRGSASESSVNEKRRKLQVSPRRDFRWSQ